MHKDRKKHPVVCVVLKGRKFTPREQVIKFKERIARRAQNLKL